MNVLVIGGLLGLAVLALLGAVLLGMGEERAEKARQAENAEPPPQPSQTREITQLTLPSTPAVARAILPSEEDEIRTLELHSNNQLVVPGENEHALLNGQVQRMTGELRALARKANELELNLNKLSEALERQQEQQNHQQIDSSEQFYTPKTDV